MDGQTTLDKWRSDANDLSQVFERTVRMDLESWLTHLRRGTAEPDQVLERAEAHAMP